MISLLVLLFEIFVVHSKLSGINYTSKFNGVCKSEEEIHNDAIVISELADSVYLNYIDECNFDNTFAKFNKTGIKIYVNVNIQSCWNIGQNDSQCYNGLTKIKSFESIKGTSVDSFEFKYYLHNLFLNRIKTDIYGNPNLSPITELKNTLKQINSNVKVGHFHKIDFAGRNFIHRPLNVLHEFITSKKHHKLLDFITLDIILPGSQIDVSQFQKDVFNEDFVALQSLGLKIYVSVSFKDQNDLPVTNFIELVRELVCRTDNNLSYFIKDSASSMSILRNYKYKRYLKSVSKDFLICENHTFIGKKIDQC
ncbi:hypothetical protein BB561_003520 [Smittium simulii]|uniref:Uncharacterized protein n=1 Tax=Smittium simulii TaxID=133385 RepID=A0A2T9YKX4_9FUNG|nr:hypothetical protein BB561_003520 [Smittium simulii]